MNLSELSKLINIRNHLDFLHKSTSFIERKQMRDVEKKISDLDNIIFNNIMKLNLNDYKTIGDLTNGKIKYDETGNVVVKNNTVVIHSDTQDITPTVQPHLKLNHEEKPRSLKSIKNTQLNTEDTFKKNAVNLNSDDSELKERITQEKAKLKKNSRKKKTDNVSSE